MAEDIIRKTVKPAHEDASIPDPAHPGIDIAQDGTEVVWDAYWIAREMRGEVKVMTDEEVEKIAKDKEDAALKAKEDAEKLAADKAEAEKIAAEKEASKKADAPSQVRPLPLAPVAGK